MPGTWHARLAARLAAPVDGASIGAFRIAFGAILLFELLDYFQRGWIARYWIDPGWHFAYWGFEWIRAWPGSGMLWHFAALAAFAACIALGLATRAAASLFCVGFSYVFLIDQARYMNHLYLVCLLAGLLAIVPAGRALSCDALWRRDERAPWVPAWALLLLRAQFAIVYVFGGLAKLNPDWISGAPMRLVLAGVPPLGPLEPLLASEWTVRFFSFGGLAFDLLIVPALLWKPTRPFAVAASVYFHLSNAWMFRIGIFPWLMLAATTLFLEPDWPRRALARLGLPARPASAPGASEPAPGWLLSILALYLAVQLLLPLRHLLYPGDPSWSEEGHRFAWRMKLHVKRATRPRFEIVADGRRFAVDVDAHLARWQSMRMATRPQMIHQFCWQMAENVRAQGARQVQCFADVRVALNGRPLRPIVDPKIDLAAVPRSWLPAAWILPLQEPLPAPRRPPRRPAAGGDVG
jgi:vitamin K-dependent gamma-carboxylase